MFNTFANMFSKETYGEAKKKVKMATVTSNLESDDEPTRRPIFKPSRYRLDWNDGKMFTIM